EIKQLHTELAITVLYVTHDQEEAMIMSDRICLMNEGEIEQIGTPDDLYFRPCTLFAADFLGESNILTGEVAGFVNQTAVVKASGGIELRAPYDQRLAGARRVALMVRPERVSIRDARTAPPVSEPHNALEGLL